jgi:opacity protein-like surface antigen
VCYGHGRAAVSASADNSQLSMTCQTRYAHIILLVPTRATVVGLAMALISSTPATATAQQTAPIEASVGYLGLSAGSTGYPKGYYVDLVVNLNSRLAILGATDAAYRSESFEQMTLRRGPSGSIIGRVPVTLHQMTRGFVVGGRVAWRDPDVDFFVQGSGGVAGLSSRADVDASAESAASIRDAYNDSRWSWAAQAGGGANIAIGSRVAARVGVDYRRLERPPETFIEIRGRSRNQLMITGGIVWRPTK